MSATNKLWSSRDERSWLTALDKYWSYVKPTHLDIEREFNSLDVQQIEQMNAMQWYEFLLNKYFFWKYTARNRYVTTTSQLKKYLGPKDNLDNLFSIKQRIFEMNKDDIADGLNIACEIRGLGTAGASGLLAVLFPSHFATVDQFAVKALSEVSGLQEKYAITKMNPEQIRVSEGAVLIKIMRQKAKELNTVFSTDKWTPRKIDMVLWVASR
ncbi:MAG: hypothetical protein AB1483_09555 [Candidatus Zixiibacteriota bacterium]